ncbi:hypothetical protein ACLKA6_010663 [Drosophila palustris]
MSRRRSSALAITMSPSSSTLLSLVGPLAVLSVLLVLLVPSTNGLANCPNGCECDDETLMVNCGVGTLDVLPIALNPSIQRLVIKNNKLKTIDSSMQFYSQLTFLDLSFNDMVTIPERSFAYHAKLQELHLNHNKIGQVSNKTFTGLTTISVLNLRGNLIAELEYRTFSPMVKLEELNLGQNRISHIDPHALDGLVNLRVLYLDDNTLTTVPSELTFQALPSLAELYLGTNSFMTIPAGAFQDLKGLTRLDLRGAGLHNISGDALKGLEGVRYLDLSDNRLQVVPTAALQHLGRLEQLSLGQNDFEVIGAGAFVGLRELRQLEITGAQRLRRVESGAFTGNTNLEHLNLSSNKQLSELHANALGGFPHLSTVILKENQLSSLSESLFPWSDLQTLDLSENPFVCDCQLMWLRNLLISKNASNLYAPVICSYPANLRELPLNQLAEPLLGCTHGSANKQAIIGIMVVGCAALITTLALVIYTCRRRIREMLKGHSALGRKEREYQKTFSDEEYMTRPPPGCGEAPPPPQLRGRGGAPSSHNGPSPLPTSATTLQQLQVPSAVDAHAPFAQLSHIHYMTNNPQTQNLTQSGATTPRSHHSQQDMRLLANGGGKVLGLNASLPRHMAARQCGVQESTLSHYSQPLANGHVGIRLNQDHFNHNGVNGGGAVYAKPCDAMADAGYIHNNSHYSLPLDHDMPPSPTPTPPPPALPLRNGMGMALVHGNTTGRRSFNGNSNNNNVATLSNNNHNGVAGGGAVLVNGNLNNNNNGSLRRYH